MTMEAIFNAVAGVIAGEYPERYIYIGQEPDQFKRPSFFLELVTTRRQRQNIGTAETELYLTLTIHETLSEVGAGDQLTALSDMDRILSCFATETLSVGDRVLPVKASSGGQDGGEAWVELTVTLRDGVGYDPDKGLPLIETVKGGVFL